MHGPTHDVAAEAYERLMAAAAQLVGDADDDPTTSVARSSMALALASRWVREHVTELQAGDVIAVEIGRNRGAEPIAAFVSVPSPLALGVVLEASCEEGDEIAIVIRRVGAPSVCRVARFPLDADLLEAVTRPPAESDAGDLQGSSQIAAALTGWVA